MAATLQERVRQVLSAVASAAAVLSVGAMVSVLALTLLDHRMLVVRSDSMSPALRAGDLILIKLQRPGAVGPGDVVTFQDPTRGGRLITHRVVERERRPGLIRFQTRGDANTGVEYWAIPSDGRVGQLRGRLPGAGRAVAGAVEVPWARTAVLAAAAMLGAAMALRRIWAA